MRGNTCRDEMSPTKLSNTGTLFWLTQSSIHTTTIISLLKIGVGAEMRAEVNIFD